MKSKRKNGKVEKETWCEHYWGYPPELWQGRARRRNEVIIARHCIKCGKNEISYTNNWEPLSNKKHPKIFKRLENVKSIGTT